MEATKAREELAEVKKEVEADVKASLDFTAEKARIVAIFQDSKEFSDDRLAFSQEAFKKGYELGKLE